MPPASGSPAPRRRASEMGALSIWIPSRAILERSLNRDVFGLILQQFGDRPRSPKEVSKTILRRLACRTLVMTPSSDCRRPRNA